MASYVGKTPARQAITADNTITSSKIVDNTISTSDILDSTITGSDLASNIVIDTTGTITSGALTACGLSYPTADGTSGQVIQTDGAGNLTFATVSGGGGGDVVDDLTPQLGGNLDLNSFDITGTNICIDASGCLGIGDQAAPTPSYNIDIAASGTSGNIRLQRANVSSQYMLIGVSDGSKHQIQGYGDKDMYLCNRGTNGSIYLGTNTINRMRIDRNGNTGFGKTSTCATQFIGSNTAYFCHNNIGGNVIIGDGCLDTGLFINAGTAYCSVIFFDDGTTSATKVGRIHYDHSDDSMSFATNVASGQNTESMRIDSSGNVGIGTTSPGHKLHIASTGDAGILIQADSDNVDETHNPYISMTQDGFSNALFTIGIEGNAGQQMTGSCPNSPFIHAFNDASIPLHLAHNGAVVMTVCCPNVGIGTSSPGSQLHIDGTNPKITVGSSGSNVTFLQKLSDDFYIFNRASAGDLLFGTADTERMRILSTGGITFNGDTATANALDDYEEGTWTPTFSTGLGSFGSITYLVQSGYYTKIGRTVQITFNIATNAITVGTASADVRISGLPFSISSSGATGGAAVFGTAWGGDNPSFVALEHGNSYLNLNYRTTSNGNLTASDVSDLSTGSNANKILGSFTYQTA